MPASLKMLDMEPDNPGICLYHCHVNHHINVGMAALYTVRSQAHDLERGQPPTGR